MAAENVERRNQHLFDSSEWNVYDSKVLNLGVGAPGADLLQNCCHIFEKATAHCMDREKNCNSAMLFQYGPTSGTFGARSAIAQYLTSMYADKVKSEDLILTSGATSGLHLIISTLLDLQGFVFVDEVTYMIALDAIKQFTQLKLIPVKLNDDGVDLIEFGKILKQTRFDAGGSKEFWAMYYTIPTYHNPTGILFSESVCEGLIELARENDLLIVCDDVYNLLCYTGDRAPKRLLAYDRHTDASFRGNVISNGSFSKVIGPGLRLGWLEVPARMKTVLDSCGIIRSGGCLNNYTAGIVCSLFELGLAQQHIGLLYSSYKERMLAASEALAKGLPKSCRMLQPLGGYFIWISMPADKDANDFLQFSLKEEKIYFIPGSTFSLENSAKNSFRVAIAFHSKEKLVDGAKRLCSTLRKYLEN